MVHSAAASEARQRATASRGRTASVAVAAALAGLVAVTGCGGKGKPPAPKPGQAALLGTYDSGTTVGQTLSAVHPNGAATDAAGTTYLVNSPALAGLSTTGKGTAYPATEHYFDATPPDGLVAMPDGTLLFGHGGEVVRFDPKSGAAAVLAGNADRTRDYNASAAATATSGSVRFTKSAVPVGVTKAGAVVILDGRALWSLAAGRLTRVHQQPVADGKDATFLTEGNAVAPDGTTYLRGARTGSPTLGAVRVISPQGQETALALPTAIPGVDGRPADLTTTWLASDGADGLYVHAVRLTGGSGGDYVLHLHNGTATVVLSAKPTAKAAKDGTCDVHKPVDAAHFPCALPRTLTYHAGQLVLAGEKSYVVRLPAT